MKTETEIEKDILNITMKIHIEYPELSKFIKEMPINYLEPNNEVISGKNINEYYNSLVELVDEYAKTHTRESLSNNIEVTKFPDYLHYPPSEDIYNQEKKEIDINPEDSKKNKTPTKNNGLWNEKTFKDDMSGDDLDVPGAELDDQQESVGSEDEENNYYSLGGDNHNDLDEDNG